MDELLTMSQRELTQLEVIQPLKYKCLTEKEAVQCILISRPEKTACFCGKIEEDERP